MKEITTAVELHSIILDLGKLFHGICVKHNIPYYMLGGTMLGAIRHKGIIPWDDDMDFGVPREYFYKLHDILVKELPTGFSCKSIYNSECVVTELCKICNDNTIIKEQKSKSNTEFLGINIDIFPLDYTDGNYHFMSRLYRIDFIVKLNNYFLFNTDFRSGIKLQIARFLKYLFRNKPRTYFVELIKRLIDFENKNFISNVYGAWGAKETVSAEVMGTPKLYDFDDTQFFGVEKPHEYLKRLYGDYMQLPPEDKRHIHIVEMYWK